MTETKRTDQHRPAVFIPEDYEPAGYFQNYEYDGEFNYRTAAQRDWELHLKQLVQGSKSTAYHSCVQCDHCGAAINYVVVQKHIPTGDYLAVGETCAAGRFEFSKFEFDAMRRANALDRAACRLRDAWNAFKAEHIDVDWDALYVSENNFVQDVLRRGRQNGTISEKQLNAIVNAVVRDAEYAARRADEAEVVKGVVVEGRYEFEGRVISKKVQDSDYGPQYKMLLEVETPVGPYRVWGTEPSSICPNVGDMVRLTARVERSRNDDSFGFYSRPSKAQVLEDAICN